VIDEETYSFSEEWKKNEQIGISLLVMSKIILNFATDLKTTIVLTF
jgi:hypothetical protein